MILHERSRFAGVVCPPDKNRKVEKQVKKGLSFRFFYGIITPRDMIFNSLLLSRKGARDHKEVRKHEQV